MGDHITVDPGVEFQAGELFSVNFSPRLQARYELSDEQLLGPRTLFSADRWSMPRARLKFAGDALYRIVQYKLELDVADVNLTVKDGYVDVGVPGGALRLMVGQYKKPFMRQQILSSGKMQFVSRAITDDYYEAGRDVGATLHGILFDKRLTYEAGLYVGNSDLWTAAGRGVVEGKRPWAGVLDEGRYRIDQTPRPMLVGRVVLYHGEYTGHDEADLKGGPLRASVSAGGYSRFSIDDRSSRTVTYSDFSVMAHGLSLSGAVLASAFGGHAAWQSRPESIGGYVQGGVMLFGLFEPLARAGRIHSLGDDEGVTELGAGWVLYLVGHRVKWQTEVLNFLGDKGTRSARLRTQLQAAF